MRWIRSPQGVFNFAEIVRFIFSTLFFFLGITKGLALRYNGLAPYYHIMEQLGLPHYFGIYIIAALIMELFLAIGLWIESIFIPSIISGVILVFAGIGISIGSLIFRWNSDCGCGLLGTNEYGLIAQKTIILIGLVYLIRKRKQLFTRDSQY